VISHDEQPALLQDPNGQTQTAAGFAPKHFYPPREGAGLKP
jgi:hypothetical protein